MLRGHFYSITEFKMMEYLRLLGCDVQIVVGPAHLPEAGRLGSARLGSARLGMVMA
jgi:hypothetical protein